VTASRSRSRSSSATTLAGGPGIEPTPGGERLVVALVRGLHGLAGTVRVEVLTDHPEQRFAPGSVVFREASDRPLTIATATPVEDGPGWRLTFREVRDRNAAEALRGAYLEQPVARADSLADDEVYWHEVEGAAVLDPGGRQLGIVRDVYRAGGAEVYVVRGGIAGEFDLPAVKAFVVEFSPREGRIVVDPDALGLELG
jgi:16S rRNA processing protein RimM